MISHRFLFLLLLLLPIHNSVAQEETFEPLFENIDITKGLPHNTVQKIFQDSEGYMWFATKDGLCRYDGYNFIVYCESLVKESISNSGRGFLSYRLSIFQYLSVSLHHNNLTD